jgi:DNA polymerase-4
VADWVLHVDLDQFLAAVEVLRRPELVGRPVVVGGNGDPTQRGVVSTASYEARAFGVRSGMPLRLAARKCPEAVFLPVDRPVYEAASEQVMQVLHEVPGGTVRVLGWDEAFVGLQTDDPLSAAEAIRAAVLDRTGLHSSVGIGDTTVRAKNATDLGKPRGTFTLTRDNWYDVMGERPTSGIWGIGPRVAARLAARGINTVLELGEADLGMLQEEFGPRMGLHYAALGKGVGDTVVDDTPWVPRAHGRETTFQHDLTEREEVVAALGQLAKQVVADLRAEGRPCQRVHLKVRFAPFFTSNRSRKLTEPTFDPRAIADTAVELLDGLADDRPVRLLGVRGEMVPPPGGY